jgi:hypothetical protein
VSYYYTTQGYALLPTESPSSHCFGGDIYHDGALCPVCKLPLLLLADFDCGEIRKTEKQKLFTELDRLPLYYCWRCCAEKLSYQVQNTSIKIFKNEGKFQGDDFPYADFPPRFAKHNIQLIPIPYETAKLLAVGQEIDSYWLIEADKLAIQKQLEPLRPPWFSKSCYNRHQIGGLLNLAQGHDYLTCPNPSCEHHQKAKRHIAVRMFELATIHNDPFSGLPMCERLAELKKPSDFNEFVQVVYWVCGECLTITTSNRCD